MKTAIKNGLKSIFPLLFLLASIGLVCAGKETAVDTHSVSAPGPSNLNKEIIMKKAATMAVPFVKNVGQFDRQVKYAADLFGGRFFLTDKELVYSLIKHSKKKSAQRDKHGMKTNTDEKMPGKGLAFKEYFVDKTGAKIAFISAGEQPAATKVSYFKGNDPSKWHSGIPSYQNVSLGQVYPGVEVKLKASGKNVEKVFYVSPQADVSQIKIGVAGITGLEIASDGRLLLKNRLGELAMRAPIAWQEIDGQRREVNVGYRLFGKRSYGFAIVDNYDKMQPLIIDPELEILLASTFLGGSGYGGDIGYSLALDSSGNVYLTGLAYSNNFPTTSGAYDGVYNEGVYSDAFIAKFNSDLTVLVASTFLGGNNYDWGNSLALDRMGNVYLTGRTVSADFPITANAYDQTKNGISYEGDVFIAKLNNTLTVLLASTYLGGSHGAGSNSLAVDNSGNVFVAGNTSSTDFPTTPGAFDVSTDRLHDIFISRLDSDLTTLLASTFLGWRLEDYEHSGNHVTSLALDIFGNVYVTGATDMADFPTTLGAYDRSYNGYRRLWADGKESGYYYDSDVFIAKLNGNLSTLMASTFLGWSDPLQNQLVFPNPYNESGYSLTFDGSGNVFVTGNTTSSGFPTTTGAYDQTYNETSFYGFGDAFIAKFNNGLTTLLASTFLGGSKGEDGKALAVDISGNLYLTGDTQSPDFPTTPGAFDRSGSNDAFVAKLSNDLTVLLASTFLGGDGSETGNSMALDNSGNAYLSGSTTSKNFPTTPGAYDQTYNDAGSYGYGDAYVSKLCGVLTGIIIIAPNGGESWIEGSRHDITWAANSSIINMTIDYSVDNGIHWSPVTAVTADKDTDPRVENSSSTKFKRDHTFGNGRDRMPEIAGKASLQSYAWTIPPTPSTTCMVRVNDLADPTKGDVSNAVFSILIYLDLQIKRREVKSLSIVKQYGQIRFTNGHPEVPVVEYRVLRREGTTDFVLLKTIDPGELQNNQFQMQDKYLKKDTAYTYRIEVYYESGLLAGISDEKTI